MLDLVQVRKTFNARTVNEKIALDGLNLHINDGDFVTVIGGNGAGKSTMLNAIAGVWPIDEGSIVIDQTEALTSIDVNTGKYVGSYSLERTIVDTNKEAAFEIARQLRLRDIGGIVIIDFIDMETEDDRNRVADRMREALAADRRKTVVHGWTRLGILEMTRKRT